MSKAIKLKRYIAVLLMCAAVSFAIGIRNIGGARAVEPAETEFLANGAQIRLMDIGTENGIRFNVIMGKTYYETVTAKELAETGVLVVPVELLDGRELTLEEVKTEDNGKHASDKKITGLWENAGKLADNGHGIYVADESGAEYMLQKSLFAAAWSYLIKRDVVADKRFVPGILHEDEEFTPRLLLDCGKTIVTKLAPYAYYQRDDSIIGNRDEGHLDRRFSDLLKVYDYLKDYRKTLYGVKLAALSRRIDQLGESFVYELIRLSPDKCFLDRWLIRVKESGVYPLSVRWYNWKYALFCGLTCRMWMVRFLYCVNKILRLL